MTTRIRLSHSSLEVLETCDRLFQLDRLLAANKPIAEAPHFSRGHAFGKGVQIYLLTGDMNKALYHAWLSYWPMLEDPIKVSLHRTLHALLCAKSKLDELLERYEVVSFRGIPAAEVGIKINIDEIYYYVAFLDLVLRNKETGLYVVLEVKYTGSWLPVDGMYMNSSQALSYSVALDSIVGEQLSEYGVLYFICQDKNKEPKEIEFHIKEWEKTLKDRLKWFIKLGLDVERIQKMRDLMVFPMRGRSCIRYNKLCHHFDTCNITAGEKEQLSNIDPHEGKYLFTFDLKDIIQNHMERT